jgi:hypothetical protein
MRRTNALFPRGLRPSVPWPRSLGTPPWGAKRELEFGASRVGTRYEVEVLRPDDADTLRGGYDRLVQVVADGQPGLLYVGTPTLPRHVVLVLPGDGDRTLDVYDPATGRVSHLRRDAFVGHRGGRARGVGAGVAGSASPVGTCRGWRCSPPACGPPRARPMPPTSTPPPPDAPGRNLC